MSTLADMLREVENSIRRAIYGPPPEIIDEKLKKTIDKVEKLSTITDTVDKKAHKIEDADDPWEEFARTIRGRDGK